MNKIKVLIADDHKLLRETLILIINAEPIFEVIASCGDSMKAIELSQEEEPDIILMDINMTPFSGIEATARIIAFNPEAKIIGMSTHSDPVYVKKMLKAGARGYITKNSPKDEMIHAMKRIPFGEIYICQDIKNILGEELGCESIPAYGLASLTGREMQVVDHVRKGLSSKEIAVIMGLALKTVEVHRHNILQKLKVKNSAALINQIYKENYTIV